MKRRVLILGGTGEARALAAALADREDVVVTSSLAGRVRDPALPVGAVISGGFGGPEGLAAHLREHVDVLVDATHPFARTITANAVVASELTSVPLVVLRRPGWTEEPGDGWHRVPSIEAAASLVQDLCTVHATVFLTTGRRELAPFVPDPDRLYLIRSVDPPEVDLPPRHELILDRGPYTVAGELALLREHDVAVLVTKDSGGTMTYPKLVAARELGVPVVMVERTDLPAGVVALDSVEAATQAVSRHLLRLA